MHRNEIFYALICINNHILSCLFSMLSDAYRLACPNFTGWPRNLNILLKSKRIAYVLEGDGPVELASDVFEDEVWEY